MSTADSTVPKASGGDTTTDETHPTITSYQDLTIVESGRDPVTGIAKSCMFYHVTEDEKVYYGKTTRNKRDLSFEEFTQLLQRVRDEEIFPEIPHDIDLKIAPDHLNDFNSYVKRPGMAYYDDFIGTDYVWKELLHEAVIMEQISKTPHPYIIRYDGCRVRHGRITSIFLERLDMTLDEYVGSSDESLAALDNDKFLAGVQSAIYYLHSLGLAHNDLNPQNIMVRDGMPVLIDFGGCAPYGQRLQSCGTPGWYEEVFRHSQKKHDEFALRKLADWLKEKQDGKQLIETDGATSTVDNVGP
ncbi:kinase-like domain-containing protein [Triangularia verruculosa]|uniref:Kinase-like domain-containing protein n=1 Tax=Triangularia verruculosa TaxID=2587418 RepID=A0AAN6X8V2_9PEZI|nr:kinase-like domain-containing protein [Triangularia verruculosa]